MHDDAIATVKKITKKIKQRKLGIAVVEEASMQRISKFTKEIPKLLFLQKIGSVVQISEYNFIKISKICMKNFFKN